MVSNNWGAVHLFLSSYHFPLANHAPLWAPQNNENFIDTFYTILTAGEGGR